MPKDDAGDLPPDLQATITKALEEGLVPNSTNALISSLLNMLFRAERTQFLTQAEQDKGNGSYPRKLGVGSLNLDLEVPRTRSGDFRPSQLGEPYQRALDDAAVQLLLRLATSSRSLNAAREALRGLGLSGSEPSLDQIAQHFASELELRNSRPLDTDLLALFLDAKYVELREGERLRPCCLYLAVGLGRDGKKRVLACMAHMGRESLDAWKATLRSLLERGLRNVLLVVHDNFPGLLGVTQSLFLKAEVQLCIVHMQRNAKSHLGKDKCGEFQNRLRNIKTCWDSSLAKQQFDQLCQDFRPLAPTFIDELTKKRDHYLAFLDYPDPLRRTFSTTNAVEAVNGQLEVLRRNNGGYFHGDSILKGKLEIAIRRLEEGRWRRTAAAVQAALHQLNAAFVRRFENPRD